MDEQNSMFEAPEDQKHTDLPASTPKLVKQKLQVQLPYLSTPGTVKTALEKIQQASTPERFNPDFVSGMLQIKGGTGGAITPFMKKIGLVNSDGTPTDLYRQFRNASTGGAAIAAAIKHGYRLLGEAHEYFYTLSDKDLLALIVQVTGAEKDSGTAKLIFYTLKSLKEFADFDAVSNSDSKLSLGKGGERDKGSDEPSPSFAPPPHTPQHALGLNLAYTINLNLPATSDQSVFNAIFRSLKEHLIAGE